MSNLYIEDFIIFISEFNTANVKVPKTVAMKTADTS